jgi:hypothetical protein
MPTSKQTKLFVLLGQKNGLSSMHSIPGSEVFYFSEFRDDSTSSASRQQSWNALVMAQAVKQGNNATGDKPKTTINSNQLKLSVSPVDPIAEFLGKLTSLTSSLAVKKDGVLATELQVVAAKAAHLFLQAPERPHTNMFLKAGHEVTEALKLNNMDDRTGLS